MYRTASWETEYSETINQDGGRAVVYKWIYQVFSVEYSIAKSACHDGCRCYLDSDFTQNPLRALSFLFMRIGTRMYGSWYFPSSFVEFICELSARENIVQEDQ